MMLKLNLTLPILLLTCLSINAQITDTNSIKNHLIEITKSGSFRNYQNIEELNRVADYLEHTFRRNTDSIWLQEFTVNGNIYKNVVASFGTQHTQRLIIGAHYDVCGNQEGADDNASGVVALLELAQHLKNMDLPFRIDLVAYTLEEPPFFRTDKMGSYAHAQWLHNNNIDVVGMISVEMIGFFSEQKGSQDYPISLLKLVYGKKGNYITLVKKFGAGSFARKFTRRYSHKSPIKTKKFMAPAILPGIDFSDHLNYWKFGYSALMITDTAFYRNKGYHEQSDTLEKLNLKKMALVIDGILSTLSSPKF